MRHEGKIVAVCFGALFALGYAACSHDTAEYHKREQAKPVKRPGPLGRCQDYADLAASYELCRCAGCIGRDCNITCETEWSRQVTIVKLTCSSDGCLAK